MAIAFAYTSFKWTNLAAHNAGVTVLIAGISNNAGPVRRLFSTNDDGSVVEKQTTYINPYLVPGSDVIIRPLSIPCDGRPSMDWGNKPSDGGNLILSSAETMRALEAQPSLKKFIFDFVGSQEFVKGICRKCLWIMEGDLDEAKSSPFIAERMRRVEAMRCASEAASTRAYASRSHRFRQIQGTTRDSCIVVPKVTSESREYLPVGLLNAQSIVSDNAFAIYDAPLWNMALIASKLHIVWVATVCGKLETRLRYSNTLGWNTFPVPSLTEQDRTDLTSCAEDILLAREAHFPATIADLYVPEAMPENLRAAHDRNDETLERIYIGRRFKNDTERLESLFAMYAKMTEGAGAGTKGPASTPRSRKKREVQA